MNILITNDDGIGSPALPHLIRYARARGEVTAVAPRVEQSGKSQAIDFTREIEIKQVSIAPDVTAFAVDSTPADCVRFGKMGLGKHYDLVLSGINRGYNLGADIVYSGTVGAIFEGARYGIMGIALSAEPSVYEQAHTHLDRILAFMEQHRLLDRHCLYNVNIPPVVRGIRITRQGGFYYSDRFVHCGGDMYRQEGEPANEGFIDLDVDIDAVNAGYISITPLDVTRTDTVIFEQLRHLNAE